MNQASSTTTITPPIAAECFSRRLRASRLVIGDVVDVVVGRCRSGRRDCIVDVVVR